MTRLTATDRLRRLLAVIPWVSGRGEVPLSEISDRFDYPIARLRRDLTEVVQFVGVYPHTPDMLIEVYLDEENERVRFELADYFRSPLRLSPEEALVLVSAGLGLLGSSAGQDTALERALTKVANRFDVQLGDDLEVSLGGAPAALVEQALSATRDRRCIEIDYHSLHRNEVTTRVVEPLHVFSNEGEWYLRGYCRLAEANRTFRLDRVLRLNPTGEHTTLPISEDSDIFVPDEDDVRVTLALGPGGAWVAEAYPVEHVEVDGDQTTVTLAITSLGWLERLLLQLGRDADVVTAVPAIPDALRSDAAARVLARYRN